MRPTRFVPCVLSALILSLPAATARAEELVKPDAAKQETHSVYDFTVNNIDGQPVKLSDYKGQVLLIVNVASECGLTDSNYKGLGPLHDKYKDQGLRVLAFPANNFGGQEPGTDAEIKSFCTGRYQVKYDLFSKISLKGDDIAPLYKYLTSHPNEKVAGPVQWNFQKYLVGRNGEVIAKFGPRTNPDDPKLIEAIEAALKEKGA